MRILLIRPAAISFKNKPASILSEPLGLMYLANYLKLKRGSLCIHIIDGFTYNEVSKEGNFYRRGISNEELIRKIKGFSPDIVGVSCMFTAYSKGAHEVARITKEISKEILVVFGGAHASGFYEGVLKDPNVNLVVRGEGEETFLEIVNKYEKGQDLSDIQGTIIKINADIKVNPPRPAIKDLDTIPFPARELLDMSDYYNDEYSIMRGMVYPRLSMITSRGCPFNCVFCSIHSIWDHSYRVRSSQNVVDEIEFLNRNYNVQEIVFYDDNMTLDNRRINNICNMIIDRKIRIRWAMPNGVAVWTLDKPTIENMKRAGCYKITFGLESGSLNTLKFIRKEFIDFKKTTELIKFCNRLGLWTMASFIIGFPYEKKDDIDKTLSFAINCDVDMASFFYATPYPGTELRNIYEKEGLIKDLGDEFQLEWMGEKIEAMCNTKYLTKDEINILIRNLKKKFLRKRCVTFLNPLRVIRKLKSFQELIYFLKMIRNYFPSVKASF